MVAKVVGSATFVFVFLDVVEEETRRNQLYSPTQSLTLDKGNVEGKLFEPSIQGNLTLLA